ncbi:MAG: hypothetical protein ACTSYB_12380 [Candidatus Helarchaeota archaeon]
MKFLGDLINNPTAAVETMEKQRNIWKTIVLFVGTGMLLMTNFFLSHFTGGYPRVISFIFLLAVLGIILELGFVMGFIIDHYIFLKLTKTENAGDLSKTLTWCFLMPLLIYQVGLFLLNLLLISINRIEWIGYIYDTFKWLLYIWVIGLSIVAVLRHQPQSEHKTRDILGVIGIFALNWAVWTTLNVTFFQFLFTTFI